MFQHKIPIHLEQQYHLIAGLTPRQVLLLGCGASLSYTSFTSISSAIPDLWGLALAIILAIVPAGLSTLTAFFQLRGRGLEQWAMITLLYFISPKILLWSLHEEDEAATTEQEKRKDGEKQHYQGREEW